jgi:hypothetical protein
MGVSIRNLAQPNRIGFRQDTKNTLKIQAFSTLAVLSSFLLASTTSPEHSKVEYSAMQDRLFVFNFYFWIPVFTGMTFCFAPFIFFVFIFLTFLMGGFAYFQ